MASTSKKWSKIIPLLKAINKDKKLAMVLYSVVYGYYSAKSLEDRYLTIKEICNYANSRVNNILGTNTPLADYDVRNALRTLRSLGAVERVSASKKHVYWVVNESLLPLLEERNENVRKIKEAVTSHSNPESSRESSSEPSTSDA